MNRYMFDRSVWNRNAVFNLFACVVLMATGAEAFADSGESEIVKLIRTIGKSTRWERIGEIPIQFQTYHPQGMLKLGDWFYFTSVRRGRQRDEGEGYLFQSDLQGNLVSQIHLERGSIYHPGGIDFDGQSIWVPVGEYHPGPDSLSLIYEVDPNRMEARLVTPDPFHDHIGAVICQPEARMIHGVNWGSRMFYRWKIGEDGRLEFIEGTGVENPNHFVDYQDCHRLDRDTMLCGGLNMYEIPGGFDGKTQRVALGGLGLIAFDSLRQERLVPVPLWVAPEIVMTRNPFFTEVVNGRLRFYFMPEDDRSVIYIYDVVN